MSARDSKSLSVTIRCNGAEAVEASLSATRAFGLDHALHIDRAARLAILVEELVINLVEHGGVDAAGEIELTLALDNDAIEIVLADTGAPFDLREAAPGEVIPERGGGAGLDLIRAWAEIVDYRSADGWNRLRLRMGPG